MGFRSEALVHQHLLHVSCCILVLVIITFGIYSTFLNFFELLQCIVYFCRCLNTIITQTRAPSLNPHKTPASSLSPQKTQALSLSPQKTPASSLSPQKTQAPSLSPQKTPTPSLTRPQKMKPQSQIIGISIKQQQLHLRLQYVCRNSPLFHHLSQISTVHEVFSPTSSEDSTESDLYQA